MDEDEIRARIEMARRDHRDLDAAIEAIIGAAKTGRIGDGKIFVTAVEQVIRIRTGEVDNEAI